MLCYKDPIPLFGADGMCHPEDPGAYVYVNPLDLWCIQPPVKDGGMPATFTSLNATDAPAISVIRENPNSRFVSRNFQVDAKLDLYQMIEACIAYTEQHTTSSVSATSKSLVSIGTRARTAVDSFHYNGVALAEARNSTARGLHTGTVAVTLGYRSYSHTTAAYSAAVSTEVCSIAQVEGDTQSVAMTMGYHSVAVSDVEFYSVAICVGSNSAAITNQQKSVACTIAESSSSICRGSHSVAVSVGKKSSAIHEGDCGVAVTSGKRSLAISRGKRGVAVNTGERGKSAVFGENAVAVNTAYRGYVKGALGCWLVCMVWGIDDQGQHYPIKIKTARVDGDRIKADTWYTLVDGVFTEMMDM